MQSFLWEVQDSLFSIWSNIPFLIAQASFIWPLCRYYSLSFFKHVIAPQMSLLSVLTIKPSNQPSWESVEFIKGNLKTKANNNLLPKGNLEFLNWLIWLFLDCRSSFFGFLQRTQRKPTQRHGEHANSTRKVPILESNSQPLQWSLMLRHSEKEVASWRLSVWTLHVIPAPVWLLSSFFHGLKQCVWGESETLNYGSESKRYVIGCPVMDQSVTLPLPNESWDRLQQTPAIPKCRRKSVWKMDRCKITNTNRTIYGDIFSDCSACEMFRNCVRGGKKSRNLQ